MDAHAASTRPAAPPRAGRWLLGAGLGLFLTATPAPAGTGGRDDCAPCTRHARAEYQAAHERSKRLGRLDCAGLAMDSEHQRQCFNHWILSTSLRPVAAPTAPTSPDPAHLPRPDARPPVETPPPPPPPAGGNPAPGQTP